MSVETEKINKIKNSAKSTSKPLKIEKEETAGSTHATDLNKILKLSKRIKDFNGMYKEVTGQDPNHKSETLSVFYEEILMSDLKKHNTAIKSQNGLYYIWTGKYWKSLEKDSLKRFIKQYIKKRGLVLHRGSSVVDGVFKNIAISTGGIVYKSSENTQLLNLDNGVLFISPKEIKFKNHNKKYNLNYCLDFNYDPNSQNELWQKFLDDVLPNRQTQRTFQQVIANLLIKGLKIEVLPFLYGTGGNGKSVVLEVLTGLFGRENVTTYSLTKITTDEKIRARIADGKIMNLSSENNMGNVNVEVAKSYSSNEPLDARLNYGNPFEIYDYAKFLGNVNKLSVMDGERTEAIARRQIIIPFMRDLNKDKTIKVDIDLHNKILENKSGVLNWILLGITEVLKNRSIYRSEEVIKILERYRKDTNPVHQMIEENGYTIDTDMKSPKVMYMTLKELYQDYLDFANEIGVGKLNRNNFKTDLLAYAGIKEFSTQNKICFNLLKPIFETNDNNPPVTDEDIEEETIFNA